MPWYLTLTLFFLAPVYTIVVRDKLWPRIQDWWATRSRSATEVRIQKLESLLAEIESLPLLTPFEDMVMKGLTGIIIFLMMMPTFAALVYVTLFRPVELLPATLSELYRQVMILLILLVDVLIGAGMQTALDRFRRYRSLEYRQALGKDIDHLRAGLVPLA
jgi:hypothetical protein